MRHDLADRHPRRPGRRRSRPSPSSSPTTSTPPASASPAGRTAATWPRSPCCARPDVFHAAVAGAPVTEWRLYDTAYTERYLGDPNEQPDVYDRNSLLPLAEKLERPLMLIHGLADDNVFAAHTLQLSSALLAAGRPHTVLPLSGVTHMTSEEVVAENLAFLQVAYLMRNLP